MKQLQVKILLGFLLLSLGLLFLDSRQLLEIPKAAIQTVTVPGQYAVYSWKNSFWDAVSFLTFWKSGEARIKNLELRILEMTSTSARADSLERENAELRRQLGVRSLLGKKMLPVTVLGVDRYLEIGAGQNEGVAEGQTVVYLDNLVGKVVRVSGRTSFVQLPTDSIAKIPAKVGAVRGLLVGQFNNAMVLGQIAQNEEVRKDDLVLTSGEGETYVPEMVVGKIIGVQSKDGLFKEAEVQALIDYWRLTTVFVILE